MLDRIKDQFLNDNSYIWLVAKSLVGHMGFKDMSDFLVNNYYIKANLSQHSVVECASGRLEFSAYPKNYDDFLERFLKELFPGGDMDQIRRDLDRNYLLSRVSGHAYFLSKEYSLYNERRSSLKLSMYCQLYLVEDDIFASILLVDLTTLYRKNSERREYAEFDTITGTFNRAYGERVSMERLEYHPDDVAAVVHVDVVGFDAINREFGQRGGNVVLVDTAIRLSKKLENNSIITRTGPDEYICLVSHTTESKVRQILSELAGVELTVEDGDGVINYRLAAGYSMFPENSRDYSQLCRQAEVATNYSKIDRSAPFFRYNTDMLKQEHESSGFNMMDIADRIPAAILVYRADGDEEILYANDETVKLFDCDSSDDFMRHVHGSWKGFVYHEDLERVEHEIWEQQNLPQNTHGKDFIRFRVITKNGVLRELDDVGKLVESPYYGKVFYVFLHDSSDKHEDLLQKMLNS